MQRGCSQVLRYIKKELITHNTTVIINVVDEKETVSVTKVHLVEVSAAKIIYSYNSRLNYLTLQYLLQLVQHHHHMSSQSVDMHSH